ncbi:SDR family NAD(P)-dependent oxidoreductase [Psychrobacillus lasiicapitis]|uniref:SDR family oxidoreductase n=1 Tax=Psychrobacillus lasiicapitis TaxID=1636719 RepID=A0A544T2P3_9BACI|nr:SDR family NAD(P)-dependent oxidoreductase [Psychrobacillus lasiicapitis]TQR11708.1 SDR family oxidoreductase [Psychrobacillus lasiicapitis]GGA18853.1 beta-ketoacyl-ACP reductase [Psychrobacillus lasiicapitis]
MRVKAQTAIITGAASGIGAESAIYLAREGANIVLVDLNSCAKTIDRIRTMNSEAKVLECLGDIRDAEFVKATVARAADTFGELHILVNNAGTAGRLSIEDMTVDVWDRDLDTNVKAAFLFIQAVVYPHMMEQKYGRIVNISSISGINGGAVSGDGGETRRSGPAYAASKGAVIALTKWVAKELGESGITCNSVAPGATATAITSGVDYDFSRQVVKRMGTPEDIAEAVLYFASSESSYTTGQVLQVDGGYNFG